MVTPFFISMEIAPPIAFTPNPGFVGDHVEP